MDIPLAVEEKVAELKKDHHSISVINGPDIGEDNLFLGIRPLKLGEYFHLCDLELRNIFAAQEYAYASSLLFCYNSSKDKFLEKGEIPIGYILEIYELVKAASEFSNPLSIAEGLNTYRQILHLLLPQAMAFIMKAFPSWTPMKIKNLGHSELVELIALAEIINGVAFNTEMDNPKKNKKKENTLLHNIGREAKINDRYISFAEENEKLRRQM